MERSPSLGPAQPRSHGSSTSRAVRADAYIVQFARCKLFIFVALFAVFRLFFLRPYSEPQPYNVRYKYLSGPANLWGHHLVRLPVNGAAILLCVIARRFHSYHPPLLAHDKQYLLQCAIVRFRPFSLTCSLTYSSWSRPPFSRRSRLGSAVMLTGHKQRKNKAAKPDGEVVERIARLSSDGLSPAPTSFVQGLLRLF